jgi:uncharacterized protein YbcI
MSTEQSHIEPAADRPVNMLLDVSNTMVRLYKDLFGRGPTKVRTYWTGPDALTVILEDTLTKAEQNMVKLGEQQRLRDTRMFFQYATVKEFCEPVERITGRTVRSFISGLDSEVNGLALETFIFYPRGQEGPSRATMAKV